MRPLTSVYIEAVARLNRRTRRAERERDEALDLAASLYADLHDAEQENVTLRARVAVLADLADPAARSMAAAVLRTIEELP